MESKTPLVVVGLPVYNGGKYVEHVIRLLLGQTHQNIELHISDNGSTDETRATCEDICQKDSRVKYHRYENNRGAFWNFQNVLDLCLYGEYFMFAAHDDEWSAEYIQRCVEFLEVQPAAVCCSALTTHGTSKINPLDNSIHFVEDHIEAPISTLGIGLYERIIKYISEVKENSIFYGIFRRSALENISVLKIFGWDWLFMLNVGLKGEFHTLEEPLLRRSMGGDSQNAINILCKIDTTDEFMLNAPYLFLFNKIFSLIGSIDSLNEMAKAKLKLLCTFKYFNCFWEFDQELTKEKQDLRALLGSSVCGQYNILLMPDWDDPEQSWIYILDACFDFLLLSTKQDYSVWLYVDPERITPSSKLAIEGMLVDYFYKSNSLINFDCLRVVDFVPTSYLDVVFSLTHGFFDCPGRYHALGLLYQNRHSLPLLNE
jgi:glycosyltransferase involved in cell wall biosynthesis